MVIITADVGCIPGGGCAGAAPRPVGGGVPGAVAALCDQGGGGVEVEVGLNFTARDADGEDYSVFLRDRTNGGDLASDADLGEYRAKSGEIDTGG